MVPVRRSNETDCESAIGSSTRSEPERTAPSRDSGCTQSGSEPTVRDDSGVWTVSDYRELHQRIEGGEVLLLDGAVGTELQALGVPIGVGAWAGTAQHTHPDTVRFMHERYIRAGVDIVTTNTYSTARHCLERIGLGDLTRELNLRAVVLAEEARARAANGRPVFIAGSVSNYGILAGGEVLPERMAQGWSVLDEDAYRANLHEQALILAESGVDLLLAESTGATEHRRWVVEACLAAGLPTWPGFKAHAAGDGSLRTGHTSDEPFADGLDAILPLGGAVMSIFHTTVDATDECLPVLRERWPGPVAVYPDADRTDYVSPQADAAVGNRDTPEDFAVRARRWVEEGAQIVGGCCGFGVEYIESLREALPGRR